MTWYLVISSVICGWAVLSVLGAERHRKLIELDREYRRKAPPAPASEEIFTVGGPISPANADSAQPPDKSMR